MPSRIRDTLRIVVQTAAACIATWFAARWLGLQDQTSWAMISSLLIVQASFDETLQATAFRIVATLLGTALGLAGILLMPTGGTSTLVQLVLAATIINALSMRWPGLRFGIVPGTILVLSTGDSLLGSALMRGAAIILGAATGVGAATLVWPDRSRTRALREVRQALYSSRDLLTYVLKESHVRQPGRLEELHAAFVSHLQQAREAAAGARVGKNLKTGRPIKELLRELERLWHGLIMLERVLIEDAVNIPEGALTRVEPSIDELHDVAIEALARIDEALSAGRPHESFPDVAGRLAEVRAHLQKLSGSLAGGSTPTIERALGTLLFGLDEVARHMMEMLDTLSYRDVHAPAGS